jgi:hypothetical protein
LFGAATTFFWYVLVPVCHWTVGPFVFCDLVKC